MSIPVSSTVRPQCSSHSRRFAPREAFQAYFIPEPRLRFTLQGLSLLPSRFTSSVPRALMTFLDLRLLPTEVNNTSLSRRAFRALCQTAIRDHQQSD